MGRLSYALCAGIQIYKLLIAKHWRLSPFLVHFIIAAKTVTSSFDTRFPNFHKRALVVSIANPW
jgi:hypothetical protein